MHASFPRHPKAPRRERSDDFGIGGLRFTHRAAISVSNAEARGLFFWLCDIHIVRSASHFATPSVCLIPCRSFLSTTSAVVAINQCRSDPHLTIDHGARQNAKCKTSKTRGSRYRTHVVDLRTSYNIRRWLYGNSLTTLPSGVFDSLKELIFV